MFNKNTLHPLFSIRIFFTNVRQILKNSFSLPLSNLYLIMGLLSVISKLIDLSSSKREKQDSLQQIISENMETIRKKNMIQLGWSPLCERRAKIKRSMLHEIQTRSTIHIPSEGLIRGKQLHC